MFTFEQIEQEQIQAQARLTAATNKRTSLEDIITNLWEEVEYLEEVSINYNLDNIAFNKRLEEAYSEYEEAINLANVFDEKIEKYEETVDLLKALKKHYV